MKRNIFIISMADANGKMWLEPEIEPEYFYGFAGKEIKAIYEIVEENKELLKKQGMSTLENKISNVKAKDPIDLLVFEKGLRIKSVIIDKDLDLLGLILNNGKILETKISTYPRLVSASDEELQNWQLIGQGIGVSWESLDEDLSVKGFIQTVAINEMLEHLTAGSNEKTVA